jgi:Spy/CpxP family protein refolding chaperone
VVATIATSAQGLSGVDERKRDAMIANLNLTPTQQVEIEAIFMKYALKLTEVDEEIKRTQTSDLPEEQISVRLMSYTQDKKDLRALRDLELLAVLDSEQKKKYEETIQPSKPQVLHFGLHNRADCNVCKK